MDALDDLEKIAQLKEKGAISEQEFNDQKKILLNRIEQENNENDSFSFPDITKEKILLALSLLGIFSISSGLGLIIAANWEIIPALVKVIIGMLLLAISLLMTGIFNKKGKQCLKEAFLFVSFLLIGGNIALIWQTYHLSLSLEQGSFIWWLLSLPLILFTKYRFLPICSVGLIVFSGWDLIWSMNYLLVASILFLLMMLTHFFTGKRARFLRELAFAGAIFSLFAGDILSNDEEHVLGVTSTVIFLCIILHQRNNKDAIIRYYNSLFIFVAWRIFLLLWGAYYDLANIGIMLIVFGGVLLIGVGLYTYYYQQIQNLIKKLVKYE